MEQRECSRGSPEQSKMPEPLYPVPLTRWMCTAPGKAGHPEVVSRPEADPEGANSWSPRPY